MDIVDETLHEWRSTPFIYGQSDCMLSIGRYLARTGHKDVTGQFIGRYDDHAGAQAMIAAHDGIVGLMALSGAMPHDDEPKRGDVVEVMYREGGEVMGIGGLCTGGMAAVRLERGVVEVRLGMLEIGGSWHGMKGAR